MKSTPARRFSIEIRVYYEDTDLSGIVYHANYLKFFERGRTEALRACGVTHSDLLAREQSLVFAVKQMTTRWLAPARIDDLLRVETGFAQVKGARMRLDQAICRGDDLIAEAAVEAACLSADGRPRRLPDDIVKRIS